MAGRPRTPVAVAKVIGADKKNPGRHASRANPKVGPLGRPPTRLNEVEREAWNLFADEMPWLAKSDRALVETASRLRARMMTDPNMGVNALAQLRMCITEMGGGPASRSKVSAPDDDGADDPASEFLN
ncbi:hypothetical protein ACUSIJ_24925 [Pseudochelatococcus sp. B33]